MRTNYGAILLAGGLSSRMGKDKSSLVINGCTLLERLLLLIKPLVEEVIVMRAPGQEIPKFSEDLESFVKFGCDSLIERGPLQGIADAIPHLSEKIDKVFILTCDLPYLTVEWLQTMDDILTNEYDIVCSEEDKITNPLLAIYRLSVLKNATKLLDQGKRRPLLLWDGWRMASLSSPDETPWICSDVNTPEEFQKAKNYFQNKKD